jgi:hypothetical protein
MTLHCLSVLLFLFVFVSFDGSLHDGVPRRMLRHERIVDIRESLRKLPKMSKTPMAQLSNWINLPRSSDFCKSRAQNESERSNEQRHNEPNTLSKLTSLTLGEIQSMLRLCAYERNDENYSNLSLASSDSIDGRINSAFAF